MKIIKIVDPEKYQVVLKERIVDFFAISGFNIIEQLDLEQKRIRRVKEIAEDDDALCPVHQCIGHLGLLLPTNLDLPLLHLASLLAAHLVGLVVGVPALLAAVVLRLAQRPVHLLEGGQ